MSQACHEAAEGQSGQSFEDGSLRFSEAGGHRTKRELSDTKIYKHIYIIYIYKESKKPWPVTSKYTRGKTYEEQVGPQGGPKKKDGNQDMRGNASREHLVSIWPFGSKLELGIHLAKP
jgi:hypothetical protein